MMHLRPTRAADIPRLQQIECAAAELFRGSDLIDVETMSVLDESAHLSAIAAGLAFVAETNNDIAAFVMVEVHAGHAYLHELDVDPAHQRKGLGALLIDRFCEAAAARGHDAVFLSTFRDAPWNAPYYARLGFHVIARDAYEPWMRAIEAEQAAFLDLSTRVFMRRAV